MDDKIDKILAAKEVFYWIKFLKRILIFNIITIFLTLTITPLSIIIGTLITGISITITSIALRKTILEYNRLNEKYKIEYPNKFLEYLKQLDQIKKW